MRRPVSWLARLVGSVLWLLGLPYFYLEWLSAEYAVGIRISTDGDSLGIPTLGFAIVNLGFVVLVNIGWAIWTMIKRRRSQGALYSATPQR